MVNVDWVKDSLSANSRQPLEKYLITQEITLKPKVKKRVLERSNSQFGLLDFSSVKNGIAKTRSVDQVLKKHHSINSGLAKKGVFSGLTMSFVGGENKEWEDMVEKAGGTFVAEHLSVPSGKVVYLITQFSR